MSRLLSMLEVTEEDTQVAAITKGFVRVMLITTVSIVAIMVITNIVKHIR